MDKWCRHSGLMASVLTSGLSSVGIALAGDIVLCSLARHYSHSTALYSGV